MRVGTKGKRLVQGTADNRVSKGKEEGVRLNVTLGLTGLLLGLPFTLRTKGEGTDSQEGLDREQRKRRFDLESLSRE